MAERRDSTPLPDDWPLAAPIQRQLPPVKAFSTSQILDLAKAVELRTNTQATS